MNDFSSRNITFQYRIFLKHSSKEFLEWENTKERRIKANLYSKLKRRQDNFSIFFQVVKTTLNKNELPTLELWRKKTLQLSSEEKAHLREVRRSGKG